MSFYNLLLTIPELEDMTDPIMEMVESIFSAAVPLIGAVGAIVCIMLGVKFAKAEDSGERDKAKKLLMNSGIGFISAFVLMVVLNNSLPILTQWVSVNYTDPDMVAVTASSRAASNAAAASRKAASEAEAAALEKKNNEALALMETAAINAAISAMGETQDALSAKIYAAMYACKGSDGLAMKGRATAQAIETAANEAAKLAVQTDFRQVYREAIIDLGVKNAASAQRLSKTTNVDNLTQLNTIITNAKKAAKNALTAMNTAADISREAAAKTTLWVEPDIDVTTSTNAQSAISAAISAARSDANSYVNTAPDAGYLAYRDTAKSDALANASEAAEKAAPAAVKSREIGFAALDGNISGNNRATPVAAALAEATVMAMITPYLTVEQRHKEMWNVFDSARSQVQEELGSSFTSNETRALASITNAAGIIADGTASGATDKERAAYVVDTLNAVTGSSVMSLAQLKAAVRSDTIAASRGAVDREIMDCFRVAQRAGWRPSSSSSSSTSSTITGGGGR